MLSYSSLTDSSSKECLCRGSLIPTRKNAESGVCSSSWLDSYCVSFLPVDWFTSELSAIMTVWQVLAAGPVGECFLRLMSEHLIDHNEKIPPIFSHFEVDLVFPHETVSGLRRSEFAHEQFKSSYSEIDKIYNKLSILRDGRSLTEAKVSGNHNLEVQNEIAGRRLTFSDQKEVK